MAIEGQRIAAPPGVGTIGTRRPARRVVPGPEPLALQAIVVLLALGTLVAPTATLQSMGASMLWCTAGVTVALAAYAVVRARCSGHNPWVSPISLLMMIYSAKYGLGLVLLYYWKDLPFSDSPVLASMFDIYPVEDNLGRAGQIIVLGACGLYLGASRSLSGLSRLLPALQWPVDDRKFNVSLAIYTPLAVLLVAGLYYYLPVAVRDTVVLFGWVVFVFMVIASYQFFSADFIAKLKWLVAILFMYTAIFSIFLFSGMREHALKPPMMILLGYVLARGSMPVRALAAAIPIATLFVLPWLSVYKTVDVGEGGVPAKIVASSRQLEQIPLAGRIELAMAGTVGRVLVVAPAFLTIYSEFYPSVYPYELARPMVDQVLAFVPRVLWPEKPNLSAELNIYPRKVGILPEWEFDRGTTTATFDAMSQYYVSFGLGGVLVLSIVHGMYIRLLYEWLVMRSIFGIGASCFIVVMVLNHDFYGLLQMIAAHSRQLIAWPLVIYLLSRRSR